MRITEHGSSTNMRRINTWKTYVGGLAVAAGLAATVIAQSKPSGPEKTDADTGKMPDRIWRNPGHVSSLDLRYGVGGKAHAPHARGPFVFVKEDPLATSAKFEIADGQGVTWKVKLGEESQSETAATRFLWAAGYFTDEDYFLPQLTVSGLPTLHRGHEFVSAGGIVHGARLERKLTNVKKQPEDWDWFDNPFVGHRELNGLRVMMSLLNNWDLKRVNNSIYVVGGERHYLVSDAGATFGNTGNALTRSKGQPAEYDESAFIAKVTPDFIDLVLHSRPFFLGAIEPPNYVERTKMETITKQVPRADVKWLAHRLSMLSVGQIRDAFLASGYQADDVEMLTATIRRRIKALEAL